MGSSILEEIIEVAEEESTGLCTIGRILKQVDDETREGILEALADHKYDGTWITKALNKRGFAFSSSTLQRHRRGGCGCGKPRASAKRKTVTD